MTTHEPSLGVDFNECCIKFASPLNQRRLSDEHYLDGLNSSTVTRELWIYSYLPTRDHRYIMEFGLLVKNLSLFESFNFFDTTESSIQLSHTVPIKNITIT